MNGAPPTAGPLLRAVALALSGWGTCAALEVAAMAVVPQSALRRSGMPWPDRAALVALDLLMLAVVVVPGLLAAGLARWRWPRAAPVRWVAHGLTWLVLSLGAASWFGLRLKGMFLDLEGLTAWLATPGQLLKWVDVRVVALVPLLGAAATWAVCVRGARVVAGRSLPALQKRVAAGVLVLLVLELTHAALRRTAARADELVVDEAAGTTYYSRDSKYLDARRTAAGAFAHALVDLETSLSPDATEPRLDASFEVARRPLLSPADYAASAATPKAWNVMVVVIESLRADRLAEFGARRSVMPTLDAFTASAARWRAWTVAPQTNYASPTVLSSQYPLRSSRLTTWPDELPWQRVMLFDVLKARGYRVGLFSSQDERWGNMRRYLETPSVDRFFEAGEFLETEEGRRATAGFGRAQTRALEGGCLDDALTVDHTLQWLGENKGPWFVALNLQVSHFPYTLPPGGVRRFGPEQVSFPLDYASWPVEHAPEVEGLYDDALGYVDAQLARLLGAVNLDDTIVVVTSDHGEAFGEHEVTTHANALFEEAVRVPLVIHAPGLAPETHATPAQSHDVAPTVAALLGLPAHPAWQGVDARQATPDRPIFIVLHSPLGHQYAVIVGALKLVLDVDLGERHLFDLSVDAAEQHDLAPTRPDDVRALSALLDSWRAAQLAYYRDPIAMSTSYAPVLLRRQE